MKQAILLIFCAFFVAANASLQNDDEMAVLPEVVGTKFIYFGYGSNMLTKRIRILNPSAVRKNIGKLKDYELSFHTNSTRWNGAPATIIPHAGKYTWGTIWEVDLSNLKDLDRQEGVPDGIYVPLSLPIETPNGEQVICRAYQLNKPTEPLVDGEDVPYDRQPSHTYLKTLIKGAIESGIPSDYVDFLRSFKHNGNVVEDMENQLELND